MEKYTLIIKNCTLFYNKMYLLKQTIFLILFTVTVRNGISQTIMVLNHNSDGKIEKDNRVKTHPLLKYSLNASVFENGKYKIYTDSKMQHLFFEGEIVDGLETGVYYCNEKDDSLYKNILSKDGTVPVKKGQLTGDFKFCTKMGQAIFFELRENSLQAILIKGAFGDKLDLEEDTLKLFLFNNKFIKLRFNNTSNKYNVNPAITDSIIFSQSNIKPNSFQDSIIKYSKEVVSTTTNLPFSGFTIYYDSLKKPVFIVFLVWVSNGDYKENYNVKFDYLKCELNKNCTIKSVIPVCGEYMLQEDGNGNIKSIVVAEEFLLNFDTNGKLIVGKE